jgi:hypothetical protein
MHLEAVRLQDRFEQSAIDEDPDGWSRVGIVPHRRYRRKVECSGLWGEGAEVGETVARSTIETAGALLKENLHRWDRSCLRIEPVIGRGSLQELPALEVGEEIRNPPTELGLGLQQSPCDAYRAVVTPLGAEPQRSGRCASGV